MNTLSSIAIESSTPMALSSPLTDEQRALRLAIVQAWKKAAHAKTTTAAQHAAYTLLRGKSLDRAFTPISNANKIVSNGNNPNQARDTALRAVSRGACSAFEPWADLLADVPKNRFGVLFEGSHPLLDRARTEAEQAM